MASRAPIMYRLLLVVVALNLAGIACFSATTEVRDPLTVRSLDPTLEPSSLLDSLAFTLMLPGIFFASIAFLCARFWTWSEATARMVWYVTGLAINMIIAWRAGKAIENER